MKSALITPTEVAVSRRAEIERDARLAQVFDAHYAALCRLAYVILGDAHLAEEMVMEALLNTFTGFRRIRDPERADVYLRRAVVNLCRSRIRRKAIEMRVNASVLRSEERKAPQWDPERHETSRLVWEAVRKLPERQRACVALFYYEDLPEAQIAEVLDCSVGTVKSQLFKAREKLAKWLGDTLEVTR
jgi:RNA polymerase sigma-70 factor (sigma-E family)